MIQDLKGYEAVGTSVVFWNQYSREKVWVTGPDVVSFLHAMLSNDVEKLEPWRGRYGTLLTATGKILFDFWYYRMPDSVLVDLAQGQAGPFVEKLSEFIIMDDVELEDCSGQFGHFGLYGPKAGELLSDVLEVELLGEVGMMGAASWQGSEVFVVRKDELADVGFEILVPESVSSELRAELIERGTKFGIEEIADEAVELIRLERGIPRAGRDFSERNNPIEAGLTRSFSLTKGCYPGQEVLAKATNIGGVARLLKRIQIEGKKVPVDGSSVSEPGGKLIGEVTSAAYSPRFDKVLALAYLKRPFSKPGTQVLIDLEGSPTPAAVVEAFSS